jgi:hypothetical protein
MWPRNPYLYLFLVIAAGLEEKTPKSFHGMSLQYCTETDGSEGMDSSKVQPSDQMELFQSFSVNRTHFELRWKSNPQVCGKNVTSYDVDVTSDSVIINAILGWFGAFPQSMCAKGSKSNNKVRTQEGVVPNSCSPYPQRCDEEARVSTIALPVQVSEDERALNKLQRSGVASNLDFSIFFFDCAAFRCGRWFDGAIFSSGSVAGALLPSETAVRKVSSEEEQGRLRAATTSRQTRMTRIAHSRRPSPRPWCFTASSSKEHSMKTSSSNHRDERGSG